VVLDSWWAPGGLRLAAKDMYSSGTPVRSRIVSMSTPTIKPRWYHLTPARSFAGLLVVQVSLFLSERYQWLPFNEHKGWTVLIAVGVVVAAVLVMLLWGLVCLCLRRRFQFSFRSLLVFLVVLSVPLGWFAWEMQKARRQREAVAAIVKAGGWVRYYEFVEFDPMWKSEATQPLRPAWLRKLLGEDFLNDALSVACVRDDDVKRLKGNMNVRVLILTGNRVTDASLEHVETLSDLHVLYLSSHQFTDAALKNLEGMTGLRELYYCGGPITDEGVTKLQQALPNCKIICDSWWPDEGVITELLDLPLTDYP
jgi:hypothetical protein